MASLLRSFSLLCSGFDGISQEKAALHELVFLLRENLFPEYICKLRDKCPDTALGRFLRVGMSP